MGEDRLDPGAARELRRALGKNWSMMERTVERIASWRDHGEQPFLRWDHVCAIGRSSGVANVPDLVLVHTGDLPYEIPAAYEWLKARVRRTCAWLEDGVAGAAEGVVVRTFDRKTIFKMRLDDYDRLLRRRIAEKTAVAP